MKKVLCHGVFDVLHAGHLKYFEGAKKYGDRLIVSVTADKFVNKGPGRPYFSERKRIEMLESLKIVDEVVLSDEATAIGVIRRLQPDFYVKGPDYKRIEDDVTGEILNEKAAVESHGGKLVFTDEETYSSGHIINRFFASWSDEQRATIEKIQSLGGITAVEKAIEELAELKVLVVGEPILDVYRFVNPEGISSKSPTVSARFVREEVYQGGSLAIKNHLDGFCKEVRILTSNRLPCKKIRYISQTQRIFEVTEIDDHPDNFHDQEFFCDKLLELSEKADLVVAADFGHGLFEGMVLECMKEIDRMIALNVQTNSSNFGFNVFTKHSAYDYLCIDTREARLACHERWGSSIDLATRIFDGSMARQGRILSMTLGPLGSVMMGGNNIFRTPAFADSIVDATGAGDAYFAMTSCLLRTGCKPEMIPFIGNVFAGLKTKIIGNKSSVTKAMLLKACEGILK